MTSYHYFGKEGEVIPTNVSELVIHPSVPYIPINACDQYAKLTRVDFKGSALKVIGGGAFYDCQALREVDIPPSVTTIENEAFRKCSSLTKVRFEERGSSLLTTIGKSSFALCKSLMEISIPSSVETIRCGAFIGCESLTRVSLLGRRLKSIESCGFYKCVQLEQVEIPRSLETMGNSAFRGCTSLRVLNIEEGNLRAIGEDVFNRCVSLHSITLPSTVERIGPGAFSRCDSLGAIKFQNGLQHVEDQAFYSCKTLQAIELPESIETIGFEAFGSCPELVSVGWGGENIAVTIRDDAFSGCKCLVNICLFSECQVVVATPSSNDDESSCTGTSIVGIDSFRGCAALEDQYGKKAVPFALLGRFDNLPIHKKCYLAPSVTTTTAATTTSTTTSTTTTELAREIEESLTPQNHTSNHLLVDDSFGMTPFHVLLSAANNCRIDLLQVLLDVYPPTVLGWKDVNGRTACEYLTKRSFLEKDARTMLRMALTGWLVDSVSSWKNALDLWKLDMTSRVNAIVAAAAAAAVEEEEAMEQRQSLLKEAAKALSRYERMEATSLLELSLWKAKLKSANNAALAYDDDEDTAKTMVVDKDGRSAHRIRSGASVVIPNVIAFF
ncbi:MAG: hypothetical protein SGBAC_001032 [Bacillariaceae sp.]